METKVVIPERPTNAIDIVFRVKRVGLTAVQVEFFRNGEGDDWVALRADELQQTVHNYVNGFQNKL